MRRKQFTFYRSFLEAIQALPKKEQLPFSLALIVYALDGEELPLSGSAASAFCIVKPLLDSSRRKAESGSLGGKQSTSKTEATASKAEANQSKHKQTEFCLRDSSKQEKEQVKEQVKAQGEEKDKDKGRPPSQAGEAPVDVVSVVVGAGVNLNQLALTELDAFVTSMGEECVLKALKAAQDAGFPTWSYMRGVLNKKQDQGVRSAEDWDKQESARAQWLQQKHRKDAAGTPRDVQPSPERIQRNADWLDEFLAQQEGKS